MLPEQPPVDPAKIALYIRWSTEDQGEGTTLDVQSEACRAYAASQGWQVREELIFVDDGYSGATLERPALSRLRRAVAEGAVSCVLVYKLDRLSRSVVDTVTLVCREWEGRCSIKSAREPIDTTTHAGRMFFYTLVNYAEWERSVIRERTHAGKLRRAQEGKNPGLRPPYGYRLADGAFVLDPDEAPVVQQIYRLYLAGTGTRGITARLNESGSRPRHAGAWTHSSVIRILANPAYTGRLEYGRPRGSAGGTARRPLVVREGVLPAIIGAGEWEAVQALKRERPGFGRGSGSGRAIAGQSLLTGLLRCRCGHGLMGKVLGRGARRYRYYICSGAYAKGAAFCGAGSVRQELVDAIVIQVVRRRLGSGPARARLVSHLYAAWQRELAEARRAAGVLAKRRSRLEAAATRLGRLLRDGEITAAEFRSLKAETEADLADVAAQRDQALRREAELLRLTDPARLQAALAQIDEWETLAATARKQVLRQFVREVLLFRPRTRQEVECRVLWRWAAGGEESSCY
jgi:site-specific DNA recombinase